MGRKKEALHEALLWWEVWDHIVCYDMGWEGGTGKPYDQKRGSTKGEKMEGWRREKKQKSKHYGEEGKN